MKSRYTYMLSIALLTVVGSIHSAYDTLDNDTETQNQTERDLADLFTLKNGLEAEIRHLEKKKRTQDQDAKLDRLKQRLERLIDDIACKSSDAQPAEAASAPKRRSTGKFVVVSDDEAEEATPQVSFGTVTTTAINRKEKTNKAPIEPHIGAAGAVSSVYLASGKDPKTGRRNAQVVLPRQKSDGTFEVELAPGVTVATLLDDAQPQVAARGKGKGKMSMAREATKRELLTRKLSGYSLDPK